MKRDYYIRLQKKYANEFVATDKTTGRVVAHARSVNKLYAELQRKGRDLTRTIVEKIEPRDAIIAY